MAHPHHVEVLDAFDRVTIRTYRAGLLTSALALGLLALETWGRRDGGRAVGLVLVGAVLAVGNLHLYDKRIRWLVQWLTWSGLLATIAAAATDLRWVGSLGLGLVCAALSALVLKEWFSFRIPLVRATPAVLALGVIARWAGREPLAAVCFGLGALGVASVGVAKLSMPLSHDLGDRRHYQI